MLREADGSVKEMASFSFDGPISFRATGKIPRAEARGRFNYNLQPGQRRFLKIPHAAAWGSFKSSFSGRTS
jgi:hypothetical protein